MSTSSRRPSTASPDGPSGASGPAGSPAEPGAPAQPLVASVYPDVPLAHLDRLFDYLVPAELVPDVRVGCRIRVRFSGKLVDAYVVSLHPDTTHQGKISPIERVISPLPVLTEHTMRLIRAVADRWAGGFCDVARLAVPPRNARSEQSQPQPPPQYPPVPPAGWQPYGAAFLEALEGGRRVRAVWNAMPGEDWPACLAEAAAATASAGRGAVLVVPDIKDAARVEQALADLVGPAGYAELNAALGPAARYRRFLRCLRGEVRIAVGTRSAVYAPVPDLGLIAIWDDGDDLYDEPRAPYPHTRDVAVLRAHLAGASVLIGGFSQSVAATALIERRWAAPLRATRESVRTEMPRITASGDDIYLRSDEATHTARMPKVALDAARAALQAGASVLVQVPRRGYLPVLACVQCHTPARCAACNGPLALPAGRDAVAGCRWCGKAALTWSCQVCSARRFRAAVVGAGRTAEELGRMMPGVRIVQSAGERVVARLEPDPEPSLVIATPGAEPYLPGGYGAVLLLDGWAMLNRAELLATEEALRRWLNAAALARPAREGGRVVVMAPASVPVIQALVRWDAPWYAERELAERAELGFPPTTRMAALAGDPAALEAVHRAPLPESADVLGPVTDPYDETAERMLLRVPLSDGDALAAALRELRAARTMRKAADRLHLKLDPQRLL